MRMLCVIISAMFVFLAAADAKPLRPDQIPQQQQLSCANMLCAGQCLDTSAGPICTPHSSETCASTLCAHSNVCVETTHGPTCVTKTHTKAPWWSGHWQQQDQPAVKSDQRPIISMPAQEQISCPMVYEPVCAEQIVQCVTLPCNPVRQTFGNACEASRDDFTVIHQGICQ